MKVEINAVIIDERIVQDFGKGELCQEWCIHGTKLRWLCDDCEEQIAKQPKTKE